MGRVSLKTALEECLVALERGESIESCVTRYPQHTRELRLLLETAWQVYQMPVSRPRAIAQEAGWQRFYARAAAMQRARTSRSFSWWKPLSIAASSLFIFLLAGGGLVYAASKAGPNDQLYQVKLVSEEARLWFAFNDEDKADLLLGQADRRVNEITQLLKDGQPVTDDVLSALANRVSRAANIAENQPESDPLRERMRQLTAFHENLLIAVRDSVHSSAQSDYASAIAKVHTARLRMDGVKAVVRPAEVERGITQVSGVAQQSEVAENVWIIGGLEVEVDARAIGNQSLQQGQLARVVVARGSDNKLRALNLTVSQLTEVPEERATITGIVEGVQNNSVVVGGQNIALTEEILRTLGLKQGRKVEINVVSQGGSNVAINI
ncbi:MAG TPA: DUF5667 domain-containing protein, partial [Dehalococcoidia bacterium]|nr:DUF5667 domain-containing protein [Dehalococcoidia bacterium]